MCPQLSGCHNELFHIRYRYHIINLIVKDGLKLIQELINKIKSAIVYILIAAPELHHLKVCTGLTIRDPGFLVQTNNIGKIRPMSC